MESGSESTVAGVRGGKTSAIRELDAGTRSDRSCGFECERALLNHFFEIIQTKFDLLVKPPFFSHGDGQLQNFDVVKRLLQDHQLI